MARIRTIKPELFEDEALGGCSRDARFLFVGLISHSDDHGRQRGNARLILANVFPYDEDIGPPEIAKWLVELAEAGVIVVYEHTRQAFIEIVSWRKHQRVDKVKATEFPEPPVSPETPMDTGGRSGGAKSRSGGATEGKGMEGNGEEGNGRDARAAGSLADRTEVVELCCFLADAVERQGVRRPTVSRQWLDSARLMIDRDGLAPVQIKAMVEWVSDDEFWRTVVLSMPKLREKWPQLWLQAKRAQGDGAAASVARLQAMKGAA